MIKKAFDYFLFSVLASGLGFLGVIYMTKTITPEEFGVIGLFLAVLYVLPIMISFSSVGLVNINKVKLSEQEFIFFSRSYFTFGMFIFLLIFISSMILGLFIEQYYLVFFLLPVLAFIMFINNFHSAELIQDGFSKRYGTYRLLLSLFSLLLTILFISVFELTWDGRLLALVLGEFLVLLVAYKLSFKTFTKFQFDFNRVAFKEYILFGLPLMIGLGGGWLLNQADRFIILNFFTLKDVGIYTVAYSIGAIVNRVNQATTNASIPVLYDHLEKKEGNKIVKKLNLYYSLTVMIISLIIGIGSYWYVPLLFGKEYLDSPPIILFIALAFAFNGIYRMTGGVIAFYKQNVLQMKLVYTSAAVNIALSILLIPVFGILSPAIATMFAYMLLAYLSYIYGWRILKKEEQC